MFIIFTSQNACRSSDGVGRKVYTITQVTSPNTGLLSSLIHFRYFRKIFTCPPRQGLHTGYGGESIILQRLLMMLDWVTVARKRRAHLTSMPLVVPKGQAPHWVPKVLQWCSLLPPGTLGEFNQPLMLGLVSWVWLGVGTHAGVNNDRGATSNIYNIYWTSSSHHITTTPLHYRLTHLGLQAYTSVSTKVTVFSWIHHFSISFWIKVW